MKKWLLVVMTASLLAMPALACGFPFPAGSSMLAVSKAVCAEDEAAASCQQRQDAYQLMSKLQTAHVTDMTVEVYIDDGNAITEMSAAGEYEYVVTNSANGIGANVHATITEGNIGLMTGDQSLDDVQFIVFDDTGYTYDDGEWTYAELDTNTLLGLGMLLGLTGPTGVGFDLYSAPGAFSVESGPDAAINGQTMFVQTLSLDLDALLMDAEALTALLNASGPGLGMMGLDLAEFGDPSQLAMMAVLLIPAFEGSTFSTTIYIGADDGYIHRVDESFVLLMDTSAVPFAEGEATQMEMRYSVVGDISAHNESLVINAPTDAEQGEGLLGGNGLGDSLFGN